MPNLEFNPSLFVVGFLLFSAVACFMLLAPLVIGKYLRPNKPNAEKQATYECGEPTIGDSNIQFDLRFYVVALLFIVFDVEIAFFFPWAVVFGKAHALANTELTVVQRENLSAALVSQTGMPVVDADVASQLMGFALLDLVVFFAVVLVGFAYVWKRGDLDWVRSVAAEKAAQPLRNQKAPTAAAEPALV